MVDLDLFELLKSDVRRWNAERPRDGIVDLGQAPVNNASLSNADLTKADLRSAGFNGSYLGGADLRDSLLNPIFCSAATLTNANMAGADLSNSHFKNANLTRADLSDTNLQGVDFMQANLQRAKMSRSKLQSTFFAFTDIRDAILDDADFDGAIFNETLISGSIASACNLDKIRHAGPSTISQTDLLSIVGSVPDLFLRGIGVPEEMLTFLPSIKGSMNPIDFYSCFVSYSSEDKSFARRLHDQLQAQGIRVWLDERQILPGDDILDELERGIRVYDKVLLCCSESALGRPWVDREINKALQKEETLWNERRKRTPVLIPLDLDGYLFSEGWISGMKSEITRRHVANFQGWEENSTFDAAFDTLVKALRADSFGRPPDPPSKL